MRIVRLRLLSPVCQTKAANDSQHEASVIMCPLWRMFDLSRMNTKRLTSAW